MNFFNCANETCFYTKYLVTSLVSKSKSFWNLKTTQLRHYSQFGTLKGQIFTPYWSKNTSIQEVSIYFNQKS